MLLPLWRIAVGWQIRDIFCQLRPHICSRAAEGGTPQNSCGHISSCLQQPLAEGGCGRDRGNEASQGGLKHDCPHLFSQAIPRAGAAENERGVNFYSDQHLSTHPEWRNVDPRSWAMTNAKVHFCHPEQEVIFRQTPWLLVCLTYHLQPISLHLKSLAQLHLNNSPIIPSSVAMQTSWPKLHANHLLLPEYVLGLLHWCTLQRGKEIFFLFF